MATLIHDATELQAMSGDLTADYELANDIDASDTLTWNAGAGFDPVGTSGSKFTGSFDGKGYTISDLFINRPGTDDVGLFGFTSGATIKDVTLTDADITGQEDTGALVGDAEDATAISGCRSTGEVSGTDYIGGLVGYFPGGTISGSSSAANVSGDDDIGGLIGYSDGVTWSECFATGVVTSTDDYCGGLVGQNDTDIMDKCYATGSVTAVDNYVGGLIGYEQKSTISNCYATGAVTGDASIGGLIGISDAATIDDCFSTGAPTGNLHVGGLIGEHSSTVTNCFWDTETSGTETSSAGTGKTTAQMKLIATFSDWSIALAIPDENNGYPYLGWQIDESDTWLIYGLSPRPTTPVQDKVTLQAIRNLEMSALGRFRVDKEGNATYKSRYARNA